MHFGITHTSIFTSASPSSAPMPTTTTTTNTPSLSSTHPINGDPSIQHLHKLTTEVTESSSPSPTLRQPPLPPTPPPRHGKRPASNTATRARTTAQLVKQEIRSKLREDWEWPPPPPSPFSASAAPQPPQPLNLPDSDSAWHERGDGFDTSSPDLPPTTPRTTTQTMDPYRYDSPNAVAATLASWPGVEEESSSSTQERKRKRKRKSEQRLREEIGWNEGMKCFVERRDAWSGARVWGKPTRARWHRNGSGVEEGAAQRGWVRAQLSQERLSTAITRAGPPLLREDISGSADLSAGASNVLDKKEHYLPLVMTTTHDGGYNNKPPSPASSTSSSQLLPLPTLVPLAPPLLPPDNAVRASITPATYPAIYSKIVIQGLTPTVPINLSDVVGALVWGWKENDEWPPKSEMVMVENTGGGADEGVGGGGV